MAIQIFEYPDASELNKIAYPVIRDAEKHYVPGGTAQRTAFNIHKTKEFSKFNSWVEKTFPKYKIAISWGMLYNVGEGANLHSHSPYPMTFVYYVNVPEDGSPLIVVDDKYEETIDISTGQFVFFPGDRWHRVPKATVPGRCIIAGQVTYKSLLPRILLFLRRYFLGVGLRGKGQK